MVQFGVAEGAPLVKDGALDGYTVEQLLEREPQAWRYPDVQKDLHSILSNSGGAVGVSNGSSANSASTRTQDCGCRSRVNPEVADELVQGDTVLQPIEQLLNGQARSPEARNSAHARGIAPDRFLKRHGPVPAAFGKCLQWPGACAEREVVAEEGTLGEWGVK